jgi:GntR family transcriptional regulator, transcriptional repressor for pyruvate dehydrogenase complex
MAVLQVSADSTCGLTTALLLILGYRRLRYASGVRTHELVLGWVEAELAAHRLVLGDRLPAERALAADLGVSRAAVREAVKVLEALGVVRSGVGSGPTAGTVVVAEPGAALGSALRLHVATDHLAAADVVETRVLLETWAAGHAVPHAAELDQADALIDRMEASGVTVEHFLVLDAAFHVALTRAAGNPLISAMMTALRDSIEGYTLSLTAKLPDWAATSERLRREHRGILGAIRAGDGGAASELLRQHIEGYFHEAETGVPPLHAPFHGEIDRPSPGYRHPGTSRTKSP